MMHSTVMHYVMSHHLERVDEHHDGGQERADVEFEEVIGARGEDVGGGVDVVLGGDHFEQLADLRCASSVATVR